MRRSARSRVIGFDRPRGIVARRAIPISSSLLGLAWLILCASAVATGCREVPEAPLFAWRSYHGGSASKKREERERERWEEPSKALQGDVYSYSVRLLVRLAARTFRSSFVLHLNLKILHSHYVFRNSRILRVEINGCSCRNRGKILQKCCKSMKNNNAAADDCSTKW